MNSLFFKPQYSENHESCVADDEFDIRGLIDVLGTPMHPTWKPFDIEIVDENLGRKLKHSDAPRFGSSSLMVFRSAAILAMNDLLKRNGELLPVRCKTAQLALYNPTRIIDALDEEASTLERFSSGRIMWIRKHVFHLDRLKGVDVFKLPMRASATFVGQRFVDAWNRHGLCGLEFVPVG